MCWLARSFAWLGRGVRTPVRKALLAGSVTKETYGRAFGFERMMDTLGAIVGPASAFFLLQAVNHHYPTLFVLTLVPGLIATGLIAFVVKEKDRTPVPHVSFGESLKALPTRFRKFLVAVGLFGAGDFAHTLLILLATQKLTPELGAAKAASIAVGLYVLHNVFYAGFAFVACYGERITGEQQLHALNSKGTLTYTIRGYSKEPMAHTIRDKKKLLHRIRRIRGQVNAVETALENEKDCSTVLLNLAACRGAINSLMAEILEGHVRFHVLDPERKPTAEQSEAAQELIDVIKSYLR